MFSNLRQGAVIGLLALTVAGISCGGAVGAGGAAATAAAAREESPNLNRYVYPLAAPMENLPEVKIDISDNPDAKEWAQVAQTVVTDWFPIVWRLLATDGQTPPKTITLIFKKKIDPPAYASGGAITVNGEWIQQHPDDFGMMVHELTHLVQSYPGHPNSPGWLVEGIADFIRWWRYEPEGPRPKIDPDKNSYRDSYRVTAAFLAFVTAKYDKGIVPKLDKSLRDGTYEDAIFKEATGKDLDTLWSEFAPKLPVFPGYKSPG